MWQHGGTPVYSPEMAAAAGDTPRSGRKRPRAGTAERDDRLQGGRGAGGDQGAGGDGEARDQAEAQRGAPVQRQEVQKCYGVADPKTLNPHGMTVQGEARAADGTIRRTRSRCAWRRPASPCRCSSAARNESHAQAVKDADAEPRARGEPPRSGRCPRSTGCPERTNACSRS